MTKIAFQTSAFCFRGSCVALYDYAHYNELLLGNESIIVSDITKVNNDSSMAFHWMTRRFPIFFYSLCNIIRICY